MRKSKEILSLVWNEFVYGGHLFSFGAVSIVFSSAILLGVKITWDCLVIVYLGMHSAYLYNRHKELKIDFSTNPGRTQYLKKNNRYIPLLIFFYILSMVIIMLSFARISAITFGFLLFLFSILYSVFFKKMTKKIVAFKSFFVSLCWASLVVFLAIYYSFPLNLSVFLVFFFVFLRLFVHENFSDIKDIKADKKEKLLTLPVVFDSLKLFNILSVITVLSVIPIIVGIYLRLLPAYSIILLLTIPYSFYYFKKLRRRKLDSEHIYNVLVDGEYILWPFLIILGRILI